MYLNEADIKELISAVAPYVDIAHYESVSKILFCATRPQQRLTGYDYTFVPPGTLPQNSGKCGPYASHKCRPGVVYLMRCGDLVKIGMTRKEVKERAAGIKSKMGVAVIPFFTLETSCRFGLESHLHSKFRDLRVSGEFFRLGDAELVYIKALSYWNSVPIRARDMVRESAYWPPPIWKRRLRLSEGEVSEREIAAKLQERFQAILNAARQLKAA